MNSDDSALTVNTRAFAIGVGVGVGVGEVALITLYDWQDLVGADGIDETLVKLGTLTITNNSGVDYINSSVIINITQDGVIAVDGIDVDFVGDPSLQALFEGNTSWNFDTVELTADAGSDYKVTSITTTEELTGVDQSLEVTAGVADTDGDIATDTFEIVYSWNS